MRVMVLTKLKEGCNLPARKRFFLNLILAFRQSLPTSRVKVKFSNVSLPKMPWARWSSTGSRGASHPTVFYDLSNNLFEDGDGLSGESGDSARRLASTLLEIHNRGHARELNLPAGPELFVHPGWHNLRNDVTGEIGFEFRLRDGSGTKQVTHLGIWDDHDTDRPVRAARAVPRDHENDQPSRFITQDKRRQIEAPHVLRLLQLKSNERIEIARIEIAAGEAGELHNSFRYFPLKKTVTLSDNSDYVLLMSTRAADGDQFHDPAAFDGLPPLIHPDVHVERSVLIRRQNTGQRTRIPAFEDLNDSYSRYRAPVGPTLRFGP